MKPCPKNKPIRLKGKKYTALRIDVYNRDNGSCQNCGKWLPLYDWDGNFNQYTCANLAHIKSRGSGGEDTPENTRILCFECHRGEHDGKDIYK